MKRLSLASLVIVALALLFANTTEAHPLIIEETSVIPNPDPTLTWCCTEIGIDGDDVILMARRNVPDPEGYDDTYTRAMHLRLVDGEWTYVAMVAESTQHNEADAPNQYAIAMQNGVAALAMIDLRVFEREGGSYVERDVGHQFNVPSKFLDIDGDTILFGDHSWGATVIRRAADGSWDEVSSLAPGYSGDGDGANGGRVALGGESAAVFVPYTIDTTETSLVMYRNLGGDNWQEVQRIEEGPGRGVAVLDMSGNVMYLHDSFRYGVARYYRSTGDGLWRPSGIFLRADGDHRLIDNYYAGGFADVDIGSNFVLRNVWDHDRQAGVIQVFQYVAPNAMGHVATLVASDGRNLGPVAIDGRRIVAAGSGKAYYFELPQQPRAAVPVQHTFESASGWTVHPGGQFSVTQGDGSKVFRQSSLAGEAVAELQAANWTHQAIQADVKITAVDGADRWAGLATRRSDASNYYYVTLRSSGIVALKRMYEGGFGTLDSAVYPFQLGRTYRLRLESVGKRHRVYVDGVLVLDAFDEFLAQGRPALMTYRAAADFDSVVVSPSDVATIWQRTAERECTGACFIVDWPTADGDWAWEQVNGEDYFAQTSLTTAGRAPAGASTRNLDQVVESRVRLRAFGEASDPWFGLMARYRDLQNYVYLSWRRSNTLTLRKLVDGQIQELGVANVPVSANIWQRLRLDAVGDRLRAFVNGRQVLEVVDPNPTPGQVGAITNRAHVDFDDFLAVRP